MPEGVDVKILTHRRVVEIGQQCETIDIVLPQDPFQYV